MTRKEVIVRAIAKELTWIQAAEICGITPRQMRRLKRHYERQGYGGLVDGRGGKTRRKRIPVATIERLCQLRREQYAEFSVQHFWEKATEEHHLEISYTWAKLALQAAGLAEKSPGRGKYRRRRERRPLRGMMLPLDGSTHPWLAEQPMQDLIVVQDDADSRILYAQFVPQEGTLSTFAALTHVLHTAGRFCELYTDRGSHFCYTPVAGEAATTAHQGQVSRALKALGIRQILAYSPQARGRSERTFQTIQGRLPQELRAAGITTYAAANAYLDQTFIPDFKSALHRHAGRRRHRLRTDDWHRSRAVVLGPARTVSNDSTVSFASLRLQLPRDDQRAHYVRCPVLVHEFPGGTPGISYQGRLLARYARDGQLLPALAPRSAAERKAPQPGTARALSALPIVAPGASLRVASTAGTAGTHNRAARHCRPIPRAPHADGAGHWSTRAGAAAHNVDGDTRNPHPPATKQRPSSRAVHNVGSSLCHHPSARTTRAKNHEQKTKRLEEKPKNRADILNC